VNKLFGPGDSCYYEIKANDQIEDRLLDRYNRKYLQIYVQKLVAMTAHVGTSTSYTDLKSEVKVSSRSYNFTTPFSKTFYLIL
jgi:hypothetical protein